MSKHAWFNEARYGMFIHWGAYSVGGRGEWMANRECIPREEYDALYAENFQAEAYDPDEWAKLAVDAGMGYAVLTTRHHDGFALWPTEFGDRHAGRIGPKRDLVGPFVESFRRAGLRVGLYYSPADWFHADYPGPHFRDWPGVDEWASPEARERFMRYYQGQIRELLTRYGKIDYLWYDGCIPSNLKSQAINEEALKLQPDLLINERNGPPSHVFVSEQSIVAPEEEILWEACMTLNQNWGYHAGDHLYKRPIEVVEMLTRTASKAGNLLLNIGPRPDGSVPEESVEILRSVGKWMEVHGSAIRGSERHPFGWNNWGGVTVSGSRIFLHIWRSPGDTLCWAEVKNPVRRVFLLGTEAELEFEQAGPRLVIRGFPEPNPASLTTTIVLEVDGTPEAICEQTSFWIPGHHED